MNETRDLLKISNCLERKKGNKRQIQMFDYNNLLPIVFLIIIQLHFIKTKKIIFKPDRDKLIFFRKLF